MRPFSNPNQTSSSFQIAPIVKCSRKKKVSLDATTVTALAKKAGYDAERDKNRKPSTTDVDSVSNAAIGELMRFLTAGKRTVLTPQRVRELDIRLRSGYEGGEARGVAGQGIDGRDSAEGAAGHDCGRWTAG